MTEQPSRLSPRVKEFLRSAITAGVIDALDRKYLKQDRYISNRQSLTIKDSWLRRRYVLSEYIFTPSSSFHEIGNAIGLNSICTGRLYKRTLNEVWNASPKELQRDFPRAEVVVAKTRGFEKGHKHSRSHIESIRAAARETHRRAREAKAEILFPSHTAD